MQNEIERQRFGRVVMEAGRIVARLRTLAIGEHQPVLPARRHGKIRAAGVGKKQLAVIVIAERNETRQFLGLNGDPRHLRGQALGGDHLGDAEFELVAHALDEA